MWQRLLDLLTAARRPLVVLDFETADLGAPPVEAAVLVFAPWAEESADPTSMAARRQVPPGLCYAASMRLNPGRPISPEAQRVHGISDEDVAKCLPYRDLAVVANFMGLALGSATDDEGPAVWCGHNLAEADGPWAASWGYLPGTPAPEDSVDTLRLVRRLQKEHPHPLVVDIVDPVGEDDLQPTIPCVEFGLDAFASSLSASHCALVGTRPAAAHGALADCITTVRVLARLLELWAPLWPARVASQSVGVIPTPKRAREMSEKNLGDLLSCLAAPQPGLISWDGWVRMTDAGPRWNRSKHRSQPLTVDPGYARWVASQPSAPTGRDGEQWCSDDTRRVLGLIK